MPGWRLLLRRPGVSARAAREESGVFAGVDWIGSGSFVERMWCKPAVSVIALDATPVDKASNTLIPVARAKISARIAPGDDAAKALAALITHLNDHAPWGAQVTVTDRETAEPSLIDFTGPYAEAARAVHPGLGCGARPDRAGGSIPMVADFGKAFPDATILITAVGDPDSGPTVPNESLHLGDFAAACLAETLMLDAFAQLDGVRDQGRNLAESGHEQQQIALKAVVCDRFRTS